MVLFVTVGVCCFKKSGWGARGEGACGKLMPTLRKTYGNLRKLIETFLKNGKKRSQKLEARSRSQNPQKPEQILRCWADVL